MKNLADKITISLDDHREIKEFFGSKRPGEKIKLRVEATVDEISEDLAVLSGDKFEIAYAGDEPSPMPLPEDERSPAIQVMKGRRMGEMGEMMEEEEE